MLPYDILCNQILLCVFYVCWASRRRHTRCAGVSWVRRFFFQAEDGIRDAQESRGLGDVYKGQALNSGEARVAALAGVRRRLLYTSDAADDPLCVDFGGRRIIKKITLPTIYSV